MRRTRLQKIDRHPVALDSTGRLRITGAALALMAALAACGGSPTRPTPPPPPPPTLNLTCPADVAKTSPNGNPFAVTFEAIATGGQVPVTLTCEPESGSPFAIGTTPVSCTARDAAGQTKTCAFSVAVAAPPRLKFTKFMAFGDSITEGVVSPAPTLLRLDLASSYPTRLQQQLTARYTAQTVTVVNAGKAGEFAADALPRLQHELKANRPQVVILAEGTNDLNAQLGPDQTAVRMEDLAREVIYFGAIAVVGTIPPMRPGGPKANCPDCVPPYNARVVALTSSKGARTVDIYPVIAADMPLLLGADGIHPTVAGYQAIATTYFDAIAALFEEAAAPSLAPGLLVPPVGRDRP